MPIKSAIFKVHWAHATKKGNVSGHNIASDCLRIGSAVHQTEGPHRGQT